MGEALLTCLGIGITLAIYGVLYGERRGEIILGIGIVTAVVSAFLLIAIPVAGTIVGWWT